MHSLVNNLTETGVLHTPEIVEAFRRVDRARFVRPNDKEYAYIDQPLPIGKEQTISQPTTVACMLELLEPSKGMSILDVGSGSGWTTALLSTIIGPKGSVIGVERIPELVELGQKNTREFKNVLITQATNNIGYREHAPYDRILVSASGLNVPAELLVQLRTNGIMVIPIEHSIFKLTKTNTGIEKEEFPGFMFVPLILEKESKKKNDD